MLARKTSLILINNVVGMFLGLVALFAIARYVAPEALGVLGYSLAIAGMAMCLGNLGFDAAHIKRVAEGRDLGDAIATYTWIKIGLATFFAIAVIGAVGTWSVFKGLEDTTIPIMVVIVVYYVATMLRMVPTQTFNALTLTAKTQLVVLIEHVTKNPPVIVVALAWGALNDRWVPLKETMLALTGALGIQGPLTEVQGTLLVAIVYAASMVISLLVAILLLRARDYPFGRWDPELGRSYLKFAIPLAPLVVFGTLANHIDSFMIGFFWTKIDVAHYFAVRRIATNALIIPTAVGTLFFPLISDLAARSQHQAVRDVATTTQRAMTLLLFLLVYYMWAFTPEGIRIFLRNDYLPAAWALRWLALQSLFIGFATVSGSIVKAYERPGIAASAGLIGLGLNIVLNAWFIPSSFLGIPGLGLRATGAALATAIAQAVHFAILLHYSHKITGTTQFGPYLAKQFVALGATALVLHFVAPLDFLGGLQRWYTLAAIGVIGAIVYIVVLWALRELGRKDLLLFRDLMQPGRMVSYVRDEFRHRHGSDRTQRK